MTISLCDQADMERLFSAYGITGFADHDEDGTNDADVVEDCIIQASGEIGMYLGQQYDTDSLASNTLVNRWAALAATYFLTMRRGNPPPVSLDTEFKRLLDPETGLIPRIGKGAIKLDGVALKGNRTLSFSNVRIDRRYPQSKVRVLQNISSQQPSVLPRKLDSRGILPDG